MIALHAVVLTLNDVTNAHQVVLVDFFHGFSVSLQCMVFTTFGFVQHCLFILAGEYRFHIDPAPMQIATDTGGSFRIATHRTHGCLQFRGGAGAVGGTLHKQGFEFRVLNIFSASLEPFLTVLAGFDQVIEYRDRFFIHVGHFSIPCG
ncbi:hypothetical protein D3C84_965740 [compost metagenome]